MPEHLLFVGGSLVPLHDQAQLMTRAELFQCGWKSPYHVQEASACDIFGGALYGLAI
jgi:hypothetical protein